jgi:hypothetical protein
MTVVCPSGTKPSTENVNGTMFVICINGSFTPYDFLILLFIVLLLISLGLCCGYFKYKLKIDDKYHSIHKLRDRDIEIIRQN